jgi:hypothetical protein
MSASASRDYPFLLGTVATKLSVSVGFSVDSSGQATASVTYDASGWLGFILEKIKSPEIAAGCELLP